MKLELFILSYYISIQEVVPQPKLTDAEVAEMKHLTAAFGFTCLLEIINEISNVKVVRAFLL